MNELRNNGGQAFTSLLSNNLTVKFYDLIFKDGCVWKLAPRTARKSALGCHELFAQGLPCFCLQALDTVRSASVGLSEANGLQALLTTWFFSCSVFSVGTMRLPGLLLCLLRINPFSEAGLTFQHLRAHCVRQNSEVRRWFPTIFCSDAWPEISSVPYLHIHWVF